MGVRKSFLVLIVAISYSLFLLGVAGIARAEQSMRPSRSLGSLGIDGHIHSIVAQLDQEFRGGDSGDSAAVDVNSAELNLTASPLMAVDANVTFLLEEGFPDQGNAGQSFVVDQAYVTIAGNNRLLADRDARSGYDVNPYYVQVGKQYVPFGTGMAYHTFDGISEPQTLAMAETLETAVTFGYSPSGTLKAYAGLFSGSGADSSGASAMDNELDDFFVGVDLNAGSGRLSLQYMNNLNNSIALSSEAGTTARRVGGLSLYGRVGNGPFTLQVAHVRSMDDYSNGGLVTGTGIPAQAQPTATTVEATYGGLPVDGTLVYERTDEWKDHPETVFGLVLDKPILPGVTGSLEYLTRDYDSTYSTGISDERLIAARLAVEFGTVIER